MFVVYTRNINGSSKPFMYKSIENAKNKLLEIVEKNEGIEFVTEIIGHIRGHGQIYSLSIKNNKTIKDTQSKMTDVSAFNNDPIMYNGPGGYYPDELHFMKVEDDDEDEE